MKKALYFSILIPMVLGAVVLIVLRVLSTQLNAVVTATSEMLMCVWFRTERWVYHIDRRAPSVFTGIDSFGGVWMRAYKLQINAQAEAYKSKLE